eukprot:jgi/Tetstr1/422210/TSEL_013062.t1
MDNLGVTGHLPRPVRYPCAHSGSYSCPYSSYRAYPCAYTDVAGQEEGSDTCKSAAQTVCASASGAETCACVSQGSKRRRHLLQYASPSAIKRVVASECNVPSGAVTVSQQGQGSFLVLVDYPDGTSPDEQTACEAWLNGAADADLTRAANVPLRVTIVLSASDLFFAPQITDAPEEGEEGSGTPGTTSTPAGCGGPSRLPRVGLDPSSRLRVPIFGQGGSTGPSGGLSLTDFNVDIQAIIANEITCDLNDVKNAIVGYYATSTNASAGSINTVTRLRSSMLLAISNVVNGNENYMRNLIQVALANNANVTDLTAQMTGLIVNNIKGNRNMVSSVIQAALFNGGSYEDIAANLTAVIATDIVGDSNSVQSLIQMAIGNNATITDMKGFYESIIVTQLEGDRNIVKSLASLAAGNNADIADFKANISTIIATIINGDGNSVNSVVDIALGNDWDMSPLRKQEWVANVTGIVVTDILGRGNIVNNMVALSAGNRAILNRVQTTISGIVSNVIEGDNNIVDNTIDVGVFNGRPTGNIRAALSVQDAIAKVDAIIANVVRGAGNAVGNTIDINVGGLNSLDAQHILALLLAMWQAPGRDLMVSSFGLS